MHTSMMSPGYDVWCRNPDANHQGEHNNNPKDLCNEVLVLFLLSYSCHLIFNNILCTP